MKDTAAKNISLQHAAETLHPLERKVLPLVKEGVTAEQLVGESRLQHVEVMRALQWMGNKGLAEIKESVEDMIFLGKNGMLYKEKGLPERRFLMHASGAAKAVSEVAKEAGLGPEEVNITLGTLKKKAAIDVLKENNTLMVKTTGPGEALKGKESLEEQFLKKQFPLAKDTLQPEEVFAYTSLKSRKDIVYEEKRKTVTASLTAAGKELAGHVGMNKGKEGAVAERLTHSMLKDSSWKGKSFRRYDLKAKVPSRSYGKKHFVNEAIAYIKKIWLEMGFEEMEGNLAQTAFWDLDALFVPQDHPAREMQDTYYLADRKGKVLRGKLPARFEKSVKETHEHGGRTGSRGWEGEWKKSVAEEVLLRTHTTVLSAQTISRLKEGDLPRKFFAVNKVFRNEALDWKHLFEFYQVEGIVVDPHANLCHLIGYLREFYRKMGYSDVRVRPGHFPYTEPSLEVEVFHPKKKEWIELGGAGIFRPEVVVPLLGKDVPVLAWGQGMERIIVDYFELTDLRDLYKNDLKQIKEMKSWMRM